jgi:hypothetical protein
MSSAILDSVSPSLLKGRSDIAYGRRRVRTVNPIRATRIQYLETDLSLLLFESFCLLSPRGAELIGL